MAIESFWILYSRTFSEFSNLYAFYWYLKSFLFGKLIMLPAYDNNKIINYARASSCTTPSNTPSTRYRNGHGSLRWTTNVAATACRIPPSVVGCRNILRMCWSGMTWCWWWPVDFVYGKRCTHFFYRQLGCLAFSLRFLPKFKQLLGLRWSFSFQTADFC